MNRRIWFARDTGFTADPRVQVLGDTFGPGGPLAMEEMMALAKLSDPEGQFTAPYATIARRAFITERTARQVVQAAAGSGLVMLSEDGGKTVSASFPAWDRWQPKDVTGAARKRQYRNGQSHGTVT